jgi:hypothetical protein
VKDKSQLAIVCVNPKSNVNKYLRLLIKSCIGAFFRIISMLVVSNWTKLNPIQISGPAHILKMLEISIRAMYSDIPTKVAIEIPE